MKQEDLFSNRRTENEVGFEFMYKFMDVEILLKVGSCVKERLK